MKNLFIIWNYIWLLSLVLMCLRSDAKDMLVDIFDFFCVKDLIGTFFCLVAVYFFLPFTIIRSLENILKINNDEHRNDKK